MAYAVVDVEASRDTVWTQLGSLARLAPSPHNTQPFRLRPLRRDDARAEVVLLADRLLPREDHGNRYVASAFGMFAMTLVRAGLHYGMDVEVRADPCIDPTRLDDTGPVVCMGEATIRGKRTAAPQAELLEARRTARGRYDGQLVDAGALQEFQDIAARYSHRFVAYAEAATVRDVLRLNADAIIDNLQLDDEREEIRPWYRMGFTPEFGDGLWEKAMRQPAWMMRAAFDAPRAVAFPGIRRAARWSYLRTQAGTRHVGLLCGPFERWHELVTAGEMLMELWLAMTANRVYMHPMGSMLTNVDYARTIAARFGVEDAWLVFRLGYCAVPPRAPRLETIVVGEQ